MPDTFATQTRRPDAAAGTQADGFIVKASKLAVGSVAPPYQHRYWLEWKATLEEATDHYADIESGEYGDGWRAGPIYPALNGMPIADKPIWPQGRGG